MPPRKKLSTPPGTVPPELARELRQSRPLQRFFDSLEDYQRAWIIERIESGKREETRKRRARRTAEWLMEVMEAERELPLALQIALARSPKARRAWEDPHYRRANLLRLFERPGLLSRAKAIDLWVEELELSAQRHAGNIVALSEG
jgi:hypothetical protein